MKCPSCGAEIGAGQKFCSACGSQISYEMQREQEQLNKKGCPQCGSSNVTFNREKQAEVRGKTGTHVLRRTVGLCKDCGYTWYTAGQAQAQSSSNIWLWVLGWIFIFPVPLTMLLVRQKKMPPALKYGIIAVAWIFYLLICIGANSKNNKTEEPAAVEETKQEPVVEEPAKEEASKEEATVPMENDATAEIESEEAELPSDPIEMNSLQSLFASVSSTMTRDEIDAYIEENGLVKYAFTHDSAYYIGYDESAIRERGRDREGEAVDISFVTSGDMDKLGMVQSAEYAEHTGFNTHTALKFENDTFYYEGNPCADGEKAMQKYLHKQ